MDWDEMPDWFWKLFSVFTSLGLIAVMFVVFYLDWLELSDSSLPKWFILAVFAALIIYYIFSLLKNRKIVNERIKEVQKDIDEEKALAAKHTEEIKKYYARKKK